MSDNTLVLYSTLGCHLCEQAKPYIFPVVSEFTLRFREVDIAEDESLVERFGVLIPVLEFQGQHLHWPFALEDVRQLCSPQ